MVVRISSGSNPTGAVYYNENKVSKGEAERLAVRNYRGVYRPVQELGLATVATKLEQQAELNSKIKKPCFHASLSLAQGEKLEPSEMLSIADRYMDGLGYGKQPYVVYQHFDTDHPHLHIVSVRVDGAGKKVPDAYERDRSNKLRQDIETEFGLQVAEKAALRPERAQLQPVEYGKGDLRRDISSVVNTVLKDYSFSSFNQFNQLLNIYNVKATEVALEGKSSGLIYSAIDSNKVAQGTAFKASSLPLQPTMETVNRRINAGKKIKGDRVAQLRQGATTQLNQSLSWTDFQHRLFEMGLITVPHRGQDGNLFGISFVDAKNRAIYTGSELGKAFTAGTLKKQWGTYEPLSVDNKPAPVQPAQPVDQSQNYSWTEDTMERVLAREELAKTLCAPYQRPTVKEKEEITKLNKEWGKQLAEEHRDEHRSESEGKTPVHNPELVRQLLYALGGGGDDQESEHDLRKMLKRANKPRLR